jgi:succinyl-CoA synthetase beta subunit
MNIHEYQAKQLLAKYGVAVPLEIPATSLDEVRAAAEKIIAGGSARVVVKSQIHAGGRGKGTFKTGFQGGVKVASSVDEAVSHAKNMLGNVLVTKQTGPEGRRVQMLLIASGAKIKKEFYLAVLLDRAVGRPLVMASTEGGMDIEEVAAKMPEKIFKEWIDPATGIMPYQARKIAAKNLWSVCPRRGVASTFRDEGVAATAQGRFAQCRRQIRHRRFQHMVGMRRVARGNQSHVRR